MSEAYKATVDGFVIAKIDMIVPMTDRRRTGIRSALAREFSIPQHYIRIYPAVRTFKEAA